MGEFDWVVDTLPPGRPSHEDECCASHRCSVAQERDSLRHEVSRLTVTVDRLLRLLQSSVVQKSLMGVD